MTIRNVEYSIKCDRCGGSTVIPKQTHPDGTKHLSLGVLTSFEVLSDGQRTTAICLACQEGK